MAKRWRIRPHDPERIAALQQAARLPPVLAQLLVCRGIDRADDARRFLEPKLVDLRPPDLLPGCTEAAARIHAAVQAGQRVVIYGDYDVDGITGAAILHKCLKLLGGNVAYHIPHRIDEGYGLHGETISGKLAADGTNLVVTVDCGITGVEAAQTARRCGIELIVTDHHEPGAELPQAAAIVHPRLPGTSYPFGGLSGSGVALKLAWAICQKASGGVRVSEPMRDFLVEAVALAALGTVADVVPLVDENRVLVREGLNRLQKNAGPGLLALLKAAKISEKKTDSEDVSYLLAPRLNAAGRFGQALLAVELLLTEKPDRAKELADYIENLNSSRQTVERSMYLAAVKMADEQFDPDRDGALVLAHADWSPGILGIVAGRLAEKYNRPTILIGWKSTGIGQGSGRSAAGVNLHAALSACGDHLVGYGGHAKAVGLRIEEPKLEAFRAAFCEQAAEQIGQQTPVDDLEIDAEAPLAQLTYEVVNQVERMGPFGQGNPRPLLCATGVTLGQPPRLMGGGNRHLSLQLQQHGVSVRGIAFGGCDWADPIAKVAGPLDVAYRPVINEFNGRRSVELRLVDWRPTAVESPGGPR